MKRFVRVGSASNILYNLRVKSGKIFLSADPSRLSLSISRLWWLLRRVSALLALHESWRHVIKMIDLKMSIMGSFVLYQTTSIHWPWPKIPGEKSMKINNYFRHCMWVTESVGWVDNYGSAVIVIWFVEYWLSLYYHINTPCRSTLWTSLGVMSFKGCLFFIGSILIDSASVADCLEQF